jgi:hypothetical protein
MADIIWEAPTVALTSYLTTTLNALANNVIDVGAAINNETNLCTFMDLEVTLASLDLSAQNNPSITIYMFESVDGGTDFDTNEDGVSAATDIPTADKIIAIMGLRVDTVAEAKTAVKSMIPIPPGRFKLGFRNTTGATLGATGNILSYRTYNLNIV